MRVLAAFAALAAAAAFAVQLAAHERCQGARVELFFAGADPEAPADVDAAVATIEDSCRGTSALVAAAGALRERDRPQALRLARAAATAEPDNPDAWLAVAATASGAEAEAAEARLAELAARRRNGRLGR